MIEIIRTLMALPFTLTGALLMAIGSMIGTDDYSHRVTISTLESIEIKPKK